MSQKRSSAILEGDPKGRQSQAKKWLPQVLLFLKSQHATRRDHICYICYLSNYFLILYGDYAIVGDYYSEAEQASEEASPSQVHPRGLIYLVFIFILFLFFCF